MSFEFFISSRTTQRDALSAAQRPGVSHSPANGVQTREGLFFSFARERFFVVLAARRLIGAFCFSVVFLFFCLFAKRVTPQPSVSPSQIGCHLNSSWV